MSQRAFSWQQRIVIRARQILNQKRVSKPFLSGDAFESLADIVISNKSELESLLNSSSLPKIVFCRSDLVTSLSQLPLHESRSILIAGNSDYEFASVRELPTSNFDSFFLQNSFISDNKKVFTLPIGIENLRIGINGLPSNLKYSQNWNLRQNKVLVGPFSPTHQERIQLKGTASQDSKNFDVISDLIAPSKFAKTMSQFKFVACPRGNGVDTHRMWEALYRGCVPIIKRDKWSESLQVLGLPIILVNEWSEISDSISTWDSNKEFDPKELKPLWINYWQELIQELN